jgi:hypothetical protein
MRVPARRAPGRFYFQQCGKRRVFFCEYRSRDTAARDQRKRRRVWIMAEAETIGTAPVAGHIKEMGMLDLRSAQTVEDLNGIQSIEQVGVIIIPEHLTTALAKVPMKEVGTIVAVPQGAKVNFQMGQVRLSGEALAAGDPEAVLILAGQLFITSPVQSVGYKEVRVTGQIFIPRGSEGALSAKLSVAGQTIYYTPGVNPRFFMGADSVGKAFFELLPEEKTMFVVAGALTIEKDVTQELLQAKVQEIALAGLLRVPKALLPIVQVLTVEKAGNIETLEDADQAAQA